MKKSLVCIFCGRNLKPNDFTQVTCDACPPRVQHPTDELGVVDPIFDDVDDAEQSDSRLAFCSDRELEQKLFEKEKDETFDE